MIAEDIVGGMVYEDSPADQLLFFAFFATSMREPPSSSWHVVIAGDFVPRLDIVLTEGSFSVFTMRNTFGLRRMASLLSKLAGFAAKGRASGKW